MLLEATRLQRSHSSDNESPWLPRLSDTYLSTPPPQAVETMRALLGALHAASSLQLSHPDLGELT